MFEKQTYGGGSGGIFRWENHPFRFLEGTIVNTLVRVKQILQVATLYAYNAPWVRPARL